MNKKLPAPDKNEQILRAIAMKRESFFQLILANLLQNESVTMAKQFSDSEGHYAVEMPDISAIVELALDGADAAIKKLYPIKTDE